MSPENEEKEYNDIESLAAYLHSGKMQALKAAEERAEMGLPPEPENEVGGSNDLEGVLFTREGKKRQTGKAAYTRSGYESAIRGENAPQPVPETVIVHPDDPAAPEKVPETVMLHSGIGASAQTSQPEPVSMPVPLPPVIANAVGGIGTDITEAPVKRSGHKKQHTEKKDNKKFDRRPEKKTDKKTENKDVSEAENASVPALAESLSAALGEKASEIAEQQRNSLPPEDTPEVYDVAEGTDEAEEFDATATRLMNAVNDPKMRSVSMKDDVEAEEEEEHEEKLLAAKLRRGYERQKQGTRTLAYILIAVILCVVILGASAYASNYLVKWALDFTGVAATEFRIDIDIPDDADIETVAAILSENNIISDARFFKTASGLLDKLKEMQGKKVNKEFVGGRYTVSSTMSYSTLLSLLRTQTTEQKTVDVRITEGMTAREIGELLELNNVCFADDFEKYYKNIQNVYEFERRVKESALKFNQLEGYLFPDTYQFYVVNKMETGGKPGKNQTAEEAYDEMKKASEDNAELAAKKMYSNFNEKMTRAMYKRMGEMNMTLDEVVAIASLVQREAAYAEDMENVASVFLNRIRNSAAFPYLQSDVSVLYVENDIKPYITGTDAAKTRIYNSYNTYVCKGIPAGAVCNPGLDAIKAVLYAPETPYFYFCANADTGEIFYAETIGQHEENLVLAGIAADLAEAERIESEINGGSDGFE
ncbi:MAG: endolytic transglycosylase MltG [Ruminiclostridium sp.]|nr:endolytic transglycosylase MltG [Ruminiclostridium sp.]